MTRYTAAVLAVLMSSPAFAELKYIPKWTLVDKKACYDFDQAAKLIEVDLQLDLMLKKEPIWEQMLKDYKEGSRLLYVAVDAEKSANDTLKTSNDVLNKMLIKETTRANNAEARPGAWPAWAIAGGIGLGVGIVAGIVLGVYVAK